MPTSLRNKRYPQLGNVTITFNDGSHVTHTITSVGDTVYDTSTSRQPVKIDGLGQEWFVGQLPGPIYYPDGKVGTISKSGPTSADPGVWIHWDEQVEPDDEE